MDSDDDQGLFRSMLGDVAPIKSGQKVYRRHKVPDTPGIRNRKTAAQAAPSEQQDGLSSIEYIAPLSPHEVLSYKKEGVQHGVFKKLRLGQYPLEATIDLHRLNFEQARREVARFVADCNRYEVRTVLITHGKGEHRRPPAMLKSCVNHWLRQVDEVLAFHSAQPRHGGTGSTYVLFRKSAARKAANRERYGLRGNQ